MKIKKMKKLLKFLTKKISISKKELIFFLGMSVTLNFILLTEMKNCRKNCEKNCEKNCKKYINNLTEYYYYKLKLENIIKSEKNIDY